MPDFEFSPNSMHCADTCAPGTNGVRMPGEDGVMDGSGHGGRWVVALALLVAAGLAAAREVSPQEAVAQAQREADGKALAVQALTIGKRKFYRIKVLTRDGQVRIVQIPAEQ